MDYEKSAGSVVVEADDTVWRDIGYVVKCMTATCHYIQGVVERPCVECPCEECCKRVGGLYKEMHRCHTEWWMLDTILEECGGDE